MLHGLAFCVGWPIVRSGMFEASIEIALLLTAAAFAARFLDAVAGGDGPITMSALLLAGAALGAHFILLVPVETLRAVLPFVLIGIAVFFALKLDLSDLDTTRRFSPPTTDLPGPERARSS